MNKNQTILLFFLLLFCGVSEAQLKVAISHAEQVENEKRAEQQKLERLRAEALKTSYDSLEACPKRDAIYGLVGQRVMVKPYSGYGSSKSAHVKFFTSPCIIQVYAPGQNFDYKGIYDYDYENQFTKYDSVKGRIFTILDIVDYDDTGSRELLVLKDSLKRKSNNAYHYMDILEKLLKDKTLSDTDKEKYARVKDSVREEWSKYLLMSNKINNATISEKKDYVFMKLGDIKDTLYYMFDKRTDYPIFPFHIEGYLDKLTQLKKNEKYAKCINMDTYTDTDFYTGKPIRFYVGQIWWLKEIVIDPKYGELKELYTNSKGETYESLVFGADFKTKKESDRIKKKYGEATWKAIMTFTIYKGMSKDAVEESWGEPKYINDASYGEQWVYDGKYVYFKNGRVTGWN